MVGKLLKRQFLFSDLLYDGVDCVFQPCAWVLGWAYIPAWAKAPNMGDGVG
jgi:hypothetical protein